MASVLNRSLERGIDILRAFRPGSTLLGNSEISDRTGLARATVSRLTQTLVRTGLLEHDLVARAYRLAAPVLSLAHAMRTGSTVLQVAAPLMRSVAEKLRVNVGLARQDRTEMVYLESIRYNGRASLRTVVSGQRVPIELTSLGRAWLAVATPSQRAGLFAEFKARRSDWAQLRPAIDSAMKHVATHGWCAASWQPEVIALARPLDLGDGSGYTLNISVSSTQSIDDVARDFSEPLCALGLQIEQAIQRG